MAAPNTLPPMVHKDSISLQVYLAQHLLNIVFLIAMIIMVLMMITMIIMVLTCIFLMISSIFLCTKYPFACIFWRKKYIYLSPMLIFKWIFCLFALLLSCVSSLYILDINLLSDIWITNILSHSVGSIFILFIPVCYEEAHPESPALQAGSLTSEPPGNLV